MADIFDVVSDGTRRRLLRALLDRSRSAGEVSVGELVAELELSQPTVSKHLKVLRDHGLVSVREEGQHRYYRIDTEPLAELEEWLAPFRGNRPAQGGSNAAVAEEEAPADTAPPDPTMVWTFATTTADVVGRAAASIAHSAKSAVMTGRLGVTALERQLGLGYRKTREGFTRIVERMPFD